MTLVTQAQQADWEASEQDWIFEARQQQTQSGLSKVFRDIEYIDGDGVRDQTVISSKNFDFSFDEVALYLDKGVCRELNDKQVASMIATRK